jgi:hypothetical protein
MLKASALYIVIIIALVIAVICSSLIVVAYFYKVQYQKKFRYDQLANNMGSGVNIILSAAGNSYINEKPFSLFGGDADSITLKQIPWGVYDIGIVKAFIQKDTLFKAFSMACSLDSSRWVALYLADRDRSFSLSGKTMIRGDAYIPKAGVQASFIAGYTYEGDKQLITGKQHLSESQLPALDDTRLQQLAQYTTETEPVGAQSLLPGDSVGQSFLKPTLVIRFKKELKTIGNIKLSGNIILVSDTTFTIDSTAILNNTLIFARSIIVKSGFHGNCQLFATDSVQVGANCRFDYPSCLGILRFQSPVNYTQAKLTLAANTTFSGTLFIYEKTINPVKSIISIGKQVKIKGQVYAQGMLELLDQSEVDGSVFCSLFLYKSPVTLFENTLVNTTIDAQSLSPYYLTSDLMPVAKKPKKVLQWIEAN